MVMRSARACAGTRRFSSGSTRFLRGSRLGMVGTGIDRASTLAVAARSKPRLLLPSPPLFSPLETYQRRRFRFFSTQQPSANSGGMTLYPKDKRDPEETYPATVKLNMRAIRAWQFCVPSAQARLRALLNLHFYEERIICSLLNRFTRLRTRSRNCFSTLVSCNPRRSLTIYTTTDMGEARGRIR